MNFKYCPYCGQDLQIKSVGNSERLYCDGCRQIQYRNPTVGVAVVLVENNKLLLVCQKLQHCLESNLLSSWLEACAAKDFDAISSRLTG